jgi:hypothetical protein
MKKIVFIASLALLGSACATTQTAEAPAATPPNAIAAIAAAEAASSKVSALGYEWRDTATLITDAKKALEAKDSATAVKLAQQAQRQSENALQQQAQQMDAASRF